MVKNSIWLIGEPFNGLVLQARTALDPMAWMKCPFFLILLSTLWLLHDVQTQVCGLTMKAKSIFKERYFTKEHGWEIVAFQQAEVMTSHITCFSAQMSA